MIAAVGALCPCGFTSCISCLAWNVCCSVAGCFCPRSAKVAKITYLLIFTLSAVLGIVLRYHGEAALSGWVTSMSNVCADGQCYGMQAAFRISASVLAFFLIMTIVTFVVPLLHHGLWLIKLCLYISLLGVSLLIPSHFFDVYSQISRYGSIVFLVIQVIIIVDLAYNVHEWLLKKMQAKDKQFQDANWEPGYLSNCWKVLYLGLSLFFLIFSIVGIAVMYKFFGACSLMQFFLSETLLVGICLLLSSLLLSRGLLTPAILFAYNTYLVYGALTNNPDAECNRMAASENQNQASIITGLTIAVLSITYAALSSAGSFQKIVASSVSGDRGNKKEQELTQVGAADVEAGAGTGAAKEKAVPQGAAASYDSPTHSNEASTPTSTSPALEKKAEDPADQVEGHPWAFHLTMTFGGLYLAMLLTNWGDTNISAGNPELSSASMWVRIVSQWLIYVVYTWSLIAPICCKNRDFS